MTKNIALLDEKNVLIGYSKKKGTIGIEVPNKCDLEPGDYRWDKLNTTFVPIPKKKIIEGATDDDLYMVATALRSIRDGKPFPTLCSKWLDNYFKDFDLKGKI